MSFIQRYFGLLLLLSCLIGLIVPSTGDSAPVIVIISLAFIIFCSYFQINFTTSSFTTDLGISLKFWLLRYIVIPVASFLLFKWISEFYALVILLCFILPSAVSSPSFSAIYGGKPALSLKVLIYSSFMAVLTIPFIMSRLAGSSATIKADQILLTLIYTIVLPFIIHLPLRKFRAIKGIIGKYNALFTFIGLSTIFIIATARNKTAIIARPELVGLFALYALLIYVAMYLTGYYLFPSQSLAVRRTFSISSGANNIGLGVTITALFFQGEMNIFFIVSQLIWVLMLVPLRRIFVRA